MMILKSKSFHLGILYLLIFILIISAPSGSVARFISPDPLEPNKPGVATNRYSYSGNDPINLSDPNGHQMGHNGGPPLDTEEEVEAFGYTHDIIVNEPQFKIHTIAPESHAPLGLAAPGFSIGPFNNSASVPVRNYLRDIEEKTGIALSYEQRQYLADDLRTNLTPVGGVTGNDLAEARRDWYRNRENLRNEWEEKTGRVWPTYTAEDIESGLGRSNSKVGSPYDAHHIRSLSDGGQNTWWNITPVEAENHQGGLHESGGAWAEIRNFFSSLF